MTRKKLPVAITRCWHCESEMEIKHITRWHKCPVCGLPFKPCDVCNLDKTKCTFDCPLDLTKKPTINIGSHQIEALVKSNDKITLVFELEEDEKSLDGASFRINADYYPHEDRFSFYDVFYDLNLQPFGETHESSHINEREKRLVMRRLRSIAKKLYL